MRAFAVLGVAAMFSAGAAAADPVAGVGLSVIFGGGQMQYGVGLRLFSDDSPNSFAGSLGVDYIFGGGGLRPTLGLAYLMDDTYVGADLGMSLNGGPLNVGFGAGLTQTTSDAATPPPPPPPVDLAS